MQLPKPPNLLTLPVVLRLPLKLIPNPLQYRSISHALNTLFSEALADGELDFVIDKLINITIKDLGLAFSIRTHDGRLLAQKISTRSDLSISGDVYAFLLLGTRTEDADTLFFRRQIRSQGDTELGLFVKNFLDSVELNTLPAHRMMEFLMRRALKIAQHTQTELRPV